MPKILAKFAWGHHNYYYYYYYTRLMPFFRTTWVSQYQEGKTSLGLNEARDDGVWDGGSISWTVCKRSASRCRQIATPTHVHSIFTGWMLFLTSTNSVKALNAKWGHHKWG